MTKRGFSPQDGAFKGSPAMSPSVLFPTTLTTTLATSMLVQDPAKPTHYITLLLLLESRVTDLDLSQEAVAELELDEIAHLWRLIITPHQTFVHSPNIGYYTRCEVIDMLTNTDLSLGMRLDKKLYAIIQLSIAPNNMNGAQLVAFLQQRLRVAILEKHYASGIAEAFLLGLNDPSHKNEHVSEFSLEETEAYRRGAHFANRK